MSKKNKETLVDVENADLMGTSRLLLDQTINLARIEKMDELTSENMKKLKLVHGFQTAFQRSVDMRMKYFKMIDYKGKVKSMKRLAKRL